MTTDHTKSFITTTHGISGHFAVMMSWNTDHGGFWEPWTSGMGRYATKAEAIAEAKIWALDEKMEYKP